MTLSSLLRFHLTDAFSQAKTYRFDYGLSENRHWQHKLSEHHLPT